uniref:Uncharacterized protein n=1 Tax=Caenorhabditis japonica TaxID=281687 RepID=A0A8R1IDX6_CAEJA
MNRAAGKIVLRDDPDYKSSLERRSEYGLESLEERRAQIDTKWVKHMILGLIDIDMNDFFFQTTSTRTRSHRTFRWKAPKTKKKAKFFTHRALTRIINSPKFKTNDPNIKN